MTIPQGVGLRLSITCAVAGGRFRLSGAVLDSAGKLNLINWLSPVLLVGTNTSWLIPIARGQLVAIDVQPQGTPWRTGDAYASLQLWSGTLAAGGQVALLCAGWPGFPTTCWWSPSGRSSRNTDHLGPQIIQVANPAAGANFSYAFGNVSVTRLLGVAFSLVTDSTSATRQARIQITPEAGAAWNYWAIQTQAASLTYSYQFSPRGSQETFTQGSVQGLIPPLSLRIGTILASAIASIQAGDQLTNVRILATTHCEEQADWS